MVLMERLNSRMDESMRVVRQHSPQPSPQQREEWIQQLYSQQIQLVQAEVFQQYHLNGTLLDLAIQKYLEIPKFKATVDRLREEQQMLFTRLRNHYWPS